MENIVLYVKSKKVSIGQSASFDIAHGVYMGSSSGTSQTFKNYLTEDEEAIKVLKESGFSYTLVDLTESSSATRLKARIGGIRTPTMILNGKKVVGLENIKQALRQIKT